MANVSAEAEQLLAEVRDQLADVERRIREHRFLAAIERGEVGAERLQALAAEQRAIVSSDRRSFAQLAARFPEPPAGAYFLTMAQGEGEALRLLGDYEAWVGIAGGDRSAHEHHPGAQAYPAFVAWLALNGSRSDVALAFVANLAAWGDNCGRVGAALRERYDASPGEVAFFEFFASPPPEIEQGALEVLAAGLAAGDDAGQARRATRLLQAYELGFWDAMAEGP